MSTQVTISRIQLINDDVNIIIEEEIDGYKKVGNEKVEAKVNNFSINRSAFTAMICKANDDIAEYRDCRGSAFDQKALTILFRGAVLVIERTKYEAGSNIVNWDGTEAVDENGVVLVHQYDGFDTKITGVKITPKSKQKLDEYCTL